MRSGMRKGMSTITVFILMGLLILILMLMFASEYLIPLKP